MSDDITFCGSECNNKKCFRHPSNIQEPRIPHSVAYLKGTEYCPMKKKETTFRDWFDEQLKDPEFKKEYDKACKEIPMPNIRLIDANALKEEFKGVSYSIEEVFDRIDNVPTVEIQKEIHLKDLDEEDKQAFIKLLTDNPIIGKVVYPDVLQGWVYGERQKGEWIDYSATFWKCPDCGHLLEKCCPNCQKEVVLPNKANMRGNDNEQTT